MAEQENTQFDALEAEQILLGSLLVDPGLFDEVSEQISGSDFAYNSHSAIYHAISELYNKWRYDDDVYSKVNIISVCDFLDTAKQSPAGIGPSGDYVEGAAYVTDLLNIQSYVWYNAAMDRIKVASAIKRAQQLAISIAKIATSIKPGAAAGEVDDAVATVVMDYTANVSVPSSTMKSMTEHTNDLLEQANEMNQRRNNGEIVDVYTGIPNMDSNITGGLIKSDLMFLAAQPGGKKSLTLQYIMDYNASVGHGVVMMSTEMLGTQLAARRIAPEADIQSRAIRSGKWDGGEWLRIMQHSEAAKCDWFLVDDMTFDAQRMVTAIRRAERTLRDMGHPLRLIGIDYLQMLSEGGGEYSADRRIEMDRILRTLRHVANTVAPVIVLSQFNLTGVPGQRPHSRQMAETSGSWKIATFAVVLWDNNGVHQFGFDKARDGVAPYDGDMPLSLAHHAWYAEKARGPEDKQGGNKPRDTQETPAF